MLLISIFLFGICFVLFIVLKLMRRNANHRFQRLILPGNIIAFLIGLLAVYLLYQYLNSYYF